jgi:hypothetical protein
MDKIDRLSKQARLEARALKSTIREQERGRLTNASVILPSSQKKDLYGTITGHCNSSRALDLIKLCSPFLYPATAIDSLDVSVETWNKKVLALEFGEDDSDKSRLFWSPLEIVLSRATKNEVLGIISFLIGESDNLVAFDTSRWGEVTMLEQVA